MIPAWTLVRRLRLTLQHQPTGAVRHYRDEALLGSPRELRIVEYVDLTGKGYYLLYLDADGRELTDTYHDTLDDALEQAAFELGARTDEWEVLREERYYSV